MSQSRLWPLGLAEDSTNTDFIQGVGQQVVNPVSQHSTAQVLSLGNLVFCKKKVIFQRLYLTTEAGGISSKENSHFLLYYCFRALGIIFINRRV